MAGCVQLRGQDRGQADRACADDRDRVARCDVPVEHADLVRGREDVGEEQDLLVAQLCRHLVEGGVGERDARELGLDAVDGVAEDPAATADAEAVVAFLAEAAASARGDARDEYAVAFRQCGYRGPGLDDEADRLVAEDRARSHLGHVALEDVQIGAADRRARDLDDRVGRSFDLRVRSGFPGLFAWAVIDECLHRILLWLLGFECLLRRWPRNRATPRSSASDLPPGQTTPTGAGTSTRCASSMSRFE